VIAFGGKCSAKTLSNQSHIMNEITPKTAPFTVPLTQSILHTWDLGSILRYCDLPGAGVYQWEQYVLPHHDLAKKHSIPK
jgi:hypothetical protein